MSAPVPVPRRPWLLGEIALVVFLLIGYDRVASVANVHEAAGLRHGRALLTAEQALHLAVERPLNLALAAHERLSAVVSVYYDFAHGLVTFGVLLAVYVLHPSGYRHARWAMAGFNAIALAVFLALPVAPPRLLPGAGFVDVVAGSGTWGAWEASASGVAEHADRFAAMPSLHVASALWVLRAVCATGASRGWRRLAVLHVVLTTGIVLATGNHYLFDVAAGALLAEGSWWLTAARGRDEARRPADPVTTTAPRTTTSTTSITGATGATEGAAEAAR